MHIFTALFLVLSISLSSWGAVNWEASAHGLFLIRQSNFHKEDVDPTNVDQTPNGLNLREAEFQLASKIDDRHRLSFLFAVAPEYESDGVSIHEHWPIEIEEAYSESEFVTDTTFRLGKFKAALGKHNRLHTHDYLFVDAPLINSYLLGEHGLNDVGASFSFYIPSSWSNEVTLQYIRGKGENEFFNSPSRSAGVGLVNWSHLFTMEDAKTLEIGVSYAAGENGFRQPTTYTGADLTFESGTASDEHSAKLIWAVEYIQRIRQQKDIEDEKGSGVATWIQYEVIPAWALLYRYDDLKIDHSFDITAMPDNKWQRHSVGIKYFYRPSISYRLELNQTKMEQANVNGKDMENAILIQANFSIGSHEGHSH
ncbi:MAG: hypothetical protein JNL11_19995 [Bdellovibrionaceae bacterium]|nr:hypothetical protein [Pseudobdellovibrionaceae bacterium]